MLDAITRRAFRIITAVGIALAPCPPAAASHLVTGNGFGFAVVAPESGAVTKFYPLPYSFVRPDPANPLSEGVETANFIKSLDPQKYYFLKEDVDGFLAQDTTLDDKIQKGDIEFAKQVFAVFLKRSDERTQAAMPDR